MNVLNLFCFPLINQFHEIFLENTFSSMQGRFENHVLGVHKEVKPFKCESSEQDFASKGSHTSVT